MNDLEEEVLFWCEGVVEGFRCGDMQPFGKTEEGIVDVGTAEMYRRLHKAYTTLVIESSIPSIAIKASLSRSSS